MQEINKIMTFALAGILGAWSRYAILWSLGWYSQDALVWGVFIVNILGCLGFGFLWPIAKGRKILLTGFMGSFTTFSSYIFEIYIFIQDEAWWLLFCNGFLQIILGLLALRLGFFLHLKSLRFS